jgi:hypothetical protein
MGMTLVIFVFLISTPLVYPILMAANLPGDPLVEARTTIPVSSMVYSPGSAAVIITPG